MEKTFRTTTDSQLRNRNGQTVTVLRPLTEAEAEAEVGPMFRVKFPDGLEADAFGDELND